MECINRSQLDLINQVRTLWMQHSEWTQMAFTAIIFKNSNENEVINRLLENPVDFAYFLRCFYGDRIASQFGMLLTEHLKIAADLVRATMAQDTALAEQINKKLYENADQIAALLSSINPY